MRTSKAGNSNKVPVPSNRATRSSLQSVSDYPAANNRSAFTLIELIVVITLISVMLFFTVPRLERTFFIKDPRRLSSWLLLNVKDLKSRAVKSQVEQVLYVDLDENKMWTGSANMDETAGAGSKPEGFSPPPGYRIIDVMFPRDVRVSSGTARIRFYPKGYSDRAVIHVETDENRRVSYVIEPFLPQVTVRDADSQF